MEVLHPRCAGLDVHKDSVTACLRVADASVRTETQRFAATTKGLLELSDWLEEAGCTHVVMEATGVYWKPVWHVLEGHFELLLANPGHVRQVPGRKSDVNDAQWLADLLAHGLVAPSFVPEGRIQEVRELTRTRKQLVRETAQHTQRIQKVLEDANLKLTGLVTHLLGLSGRAILEALIQGETDPGRLADLTEGRLRKASREELVQALQGVVTEHHRFLLRLHLDQIDMLEGAIARVERRLGDSLQPFREQQRLLATIPGVSRIAAQVILAEIGPDMARFPSVGHLVSWAGLCPQMHESAGKRRSTRIRKGAPWLKTVLVQSGWAAARSKGTYLQARFYRLKARRGPKKAVVAIAADILRAAYFILQRNVPYQDLGPDYFDHLDATRAAARYVRRLESLGYAVTLAPGA